MVRLSLWGIASLLLVLGAIGLGRYAHRITGRSIEAHHRQSHPATTGEEDEVSEAIRRRNAISGGKFHKALKTYVDHPGIDQPRLRKIDDVKLTDATPIIGIEFEGEAVAFVMEKMMDPWAHIVNLNLGNRRSISVTYCYLIDCVRVVHDASDDPIPLHVGGLDIDNQMVILYDGERYAMNSPELPFADFPFERSTLGEWKQSHPKTKVCIPPSRASIAHRKLDAKQSKGS